MIKDQTLKLALEAYLCREMPAGTVIGDPKWWATKIAAALKEALAQQPVSNTDELPKGFIPLEQENGRIIYAACLDPNARHYRWLMWKHPDGQWVSKRKLEEWEVMQAEDQSYYGIILGTSAHNIKENT